MDPYEHARQDGIEGVKKFAAALKEIFYKPPIPALIKLKENSGYDWRKLRRFFSHFLDVKRDLKGNPHEKILTTLYYKHAADVLNKMEFQEDGGFTSVKKLSHAQNSLKTLKKLPYDSKIMAYIIDGFNTVKSGNK